MDQLVPLECQGTRFSVLATSFALSLQGEVAAIALCVGCNNTAAVSSFRSARVCPLQLSNVVVIEYQRLGGGSNTGVPRVAEQDWCQLPLSVCCASLTVLRILTGQTPCTW